ncbi:MAG: hypothetical protein Q8R13_01975 [bacterium]|nr:hypothetical protein [bacterium]MDZ4296195.1 hypothetical protein [Patescibacteria group bacterium]
MQKYSEIIEGYLAFSAAADTLLFAANDSYRSSDPQDDPKQERVLEELMEEVEKANRAVTSQFVRVMLEHEHESSLTPENLRVLFTGIVIGLAKGSRDNPGDYPELLKHFREIQASLLL